MKAIAQDVLQHLSRWLNEENDQPVWLCTIVATVGSSPRPVGAMLACNHRGEQVGSLSGGCVEDDLLARLEAGTLSAERPTMIEYGVTAEENERLGLPCGGRLHVLVETLGHSDLDWVEAVLQALEARRCVQRQCSLANGHSEVSNAQRFHPLSMDENALTQCFGPSQRMLLVGAGQLSQSLAELATAMDYEVIVTDPRQRMLDAWEGPDVQRQAGMPDDAVRALADDDHSVIITLTHDPRIDDMALMEALETRAWYVGALGSARTTEKRLQRLRQLDVPESAIDRLHAPVGLSIGSKTPVEIAVSIMAQVTQLRVARERVE